MVNEGMREYYCFRCGNVLARPIELTASYCYDKKTEKTFLVCKKCTKKKDQIIWGICPSENDFRSTLDDIIQSK